MPNKMHSERPPKINCALADLNCPLKLSNVKCSKHALKRIIERGYTMSEIEQMLGDIDEHIILKIVTVLPKKKHVTDHTCDLQVRQLQSDNTSVELFMQLCTAQEVLKQCQKKMKIKKWSQQVEKLQQLVNKNPCSKISSAHKRICQSIAKAEAKIQDASTKKQKRKCRRCIRKLKKQLVLLT